MPPGLAGPSAPAAAASALGGRGHHRSRPGSRLLTAAAAVLGLAVVRSTGLAFAPAAPRTPLRPPSYVRCGAEAAAAAGAGGSAADVARERFLKVLEEKGGDWRDEAVAAELKLLEEANPTKDAALTGEYLDADWLQVSRADYAFGDGSTVYPLGKLAFNMYEPKDMKFEVEKTTQIVAPIPGGEGARKWDISMELKCVDERCPAFRALMTTYGKIVPAEAKDKSNRLDVTFSGGDLKPAPGTSAEDLEKWLEVFGAAQKNKKRTIGSMLQNWVMGLMMGLRPPTGVEKDGTIAFKMEKPPHGYTDILYLDDKLRVTRGNRGSVVAVTRGSP